MFYFIEVMGCTIVISVYTLYVICRGPCYGLLMVLVVDGRGICLGLLTPGSCALVIMGRHVELQAPRQDFPIAYSRRFDR